MDCKYCRLCQTYQYINLFNQSILRQIWSIVCLHAQALVYNANKRINTQATLSQVSICTVWVNLFEDFRCLMFWLHSLARIRFSMYFVQNLELFRQFYVTLFLYDINSRQNQCNLIFFLKTIMIINELILFELFWNRFHKV